VYFKTRIKIFQQVRAIYLSCIILISSLLSCAQNFNFEKMRQNMVETQIEARGISSPKILKAFMNVERHRFVLPRYISKAYDDNPLPIDEGQTISQPYIVAFMTQSLNLKQKDKVLEIGTGSGYQAAILGQLCDSVYTVEIFPKLGKKANDLFIELGYSNIYSKVGDGYEGWSEHAPFDAIIVTCSPTHIPQPLKDQLAEGGRMVIPVGSYPFQNLVLLEKRKGIIREKKILPVRFVPMLDKEGDRY